MSPHGSKESNDLKETIDLNDITLISSSKNTGIIHNSDTFRSLSARLPKFSRPEPNLTKEFFSSLIRPIPHNEIQLVNFHIYGGPSTGKSTLSRAIGYYLKDFYGEKCQCIECSFLPDAIHHIDPTKQVLVISVDDPMGAAEAGGTQDARRASSSDVDLARSTFNAIRHIYAKRVLLYRAQRQYGNPIPDDIVKDIERYHDNRDKLATIFSKAFVSVSAIIFVMWGPQLPTIDQTFHQNKMWNIYKGFSSMDQKRKHELERHLGIFWTNKLGAKEKAWRRETDKDARSWSVIEDPFTNNKGWLYVTPAEENIFFKVDRGGKGFQQKVRDDTEKMDIWAQLIYETRNSLTPPYDPFGKKEDRTRSISNFITDTLKSNKDPRTFEELAPHIQIFLRSLIKGKMQILDNRIIKFHCLNLDERKHIERLAQELIAIIEGEKITPYFKKARNIIHDIARRKLSIYSQFIDKPGNFMKIYDHLLYLWKVYHPEDGIGKKAMPAGSAREIDRQLVEQATVEMPENAIEFAISEEEIINSILKSHPDYRDRAMVYMHSEGIGDREILTNRQIYRISLDKKQRKQYGFPDAFASEEAVKYRKKQFRGSMSYTLGQLFEEWLEQILVDGYHIPNVLENIETVRHSSYEQKGQPDFVLTHTDGSTTVLAAKCYASPRSETLEKEEITPELRYHNNLLEKGEHARIAVVYCNINIPHLLIVYTYQHASDVPVNLTFSPSQASRFVFRR